MIADAAVLAKSEILERVAERVAARVLVDDALYSVTETAGLLGLRRTKSVYDIPPAELARTPTGPGGGNLMFLGADIRRFVVGRRRSQ